MTLTNSETLRLGKINYSNVWPIFHYFQQDKLGIPVEWVSQVPTELNEAMRNGTIAMGPISSFSYGENSKKYYIMPNLSVSAFGQVHSLLLFLKKPLSDVLQGKIAVTTTSATTVNLLKIIMKKFYGGNPSYIPMAPHLETMMLDADAAMLIGDHAIKASWQNHNYEVIDLGECWNKFTGEWMTFAIWAMSADAIRRYPRYILTIINEFMASKQRSMEDLQPLISKACQSIGGDAIYWRRYFTDLNYDFGAAQQRGLNLYFRYCFELGYLSEVPQLCVWNKSMMQVKK